MVIVKNLRKNYFDIKSDKFAGIGNRQNPEKGLTFSVKDGEVFGVMGPDGAGKTTLFRILATLLLPDSGSAAMNGLNVVKDFRKVRQKIGYMPGQFSLYPDLSVQENLEFFATLFDTTVEHNYHLIRDIYQQIKPFEKRKAGALSGGMKQKLALCCVLIHKPDVLILDEPTTGVDPVSRKEFWDMLHRLREEKIAILISTAYMDEAGRCNRVALMRKGEFIAIDSPEKIVADYSENLWSVKADNMFSLLRELRKKSTVETCFSFGDTHHITVTDDFDKQILMNGLSEKGFKNLEIDAIEPSIEDCFMALTKDE